jgi:hypothetical protein
MSKKKIIGLCIGAVLAMSSVNSYAIVVIDPVNLVQNTVSAIESTMSYAQQGSQYITQLMQYKQQMIDATKTPLGQITQASTQLIQQYNQLAQAKQAIEQVYGSAQNAQAQYQYRVRDMQAAGTGNFKDYLTYQAKMSSQNHTTLQTAFQRDLQLGDRLQADLQDANNKINAVPGIVGTNDALNNLNISMQQIRAGQAQFTQMLQYAQLHQDDKDMKAQTNEDLANQMLTNGFNAQAQSNAAADAAKGARTVVNFGSLK